jgi:hypothetical protein
MELIGSLILLGIVIVLVVLFVTQPLTLRRRVRTEANPLLSSLLAERDRVLNSLKELDFDNSLGKIPAEAYPEQRLSLVQQGAEILRKLDQLAPVQAPVTSLPTGKEDPVEAMLAARRLRLSTVAGKNEAEDKDKDKAESLIASRRTVRPVESGNFCSHCGRALLTSDRFCPGCGQAVQ